MTFARYPRYKNLTKGFLGEVPSLWSVLRLKDVLAQRITDGPHTTPVFLSEGVPFLSVDAIQDGELVFDGCRFVSLGNHTEYSAKASPRRDDILMGKAASTGKVARVKVDFSFSIWSPLALIRVARYLITPAFAEYVLKSDSVQAQIENLCTANTQKNISMDDIPRLVIPHPPASEQALIVEFLDHETTKIDALIAEQQRLIELLKEKRQAVISHAVTRGLNPDAPVKPSGIEWLGDIPAHWELVAWKRIVSMRSGRSITGEEIEDAGTYPVLGGNGIRGFTSGYTHDGDFAVIGRQGALCGNVNYGVGKFWASEHAVVVTPRIQLNTLWTGEILRVMNLNQYSVSAAQPGLSVEVVGNLFTCLPPLEEQNAIARTIEQHLLNSASLVDGALEAIALLRERRTALISAAVTGKIDVRNYATSEAA